MPVEMTRLRFEELVAQALDEVPPQFAKAMDNVVVLVEDPDPNCPFGAKEVGLTFEEVLKADVAAKPGVQALQQKLLETRYNLQPKLDPEASTPPIAMKPPSTCTHSSPAIGCFSNSRTHDSGKMVTMWNSA